jgi:hypothetical protein
VLDIGEAMSLDADVMGCGKGNECERQRGIDVRGRGVESRDESQKVAYEDEKKEGTKFSRPSTMVSRRFCTPLGAVFLSEKRAARERPIRIAIASQE